MQFAKSATGKASKGFTAEELAAMRERAQELKAAARRGPGAGKADGENAVLEKIAAMPEPDGAIGERLHAIVKASAPALSPKLRLIVMSNARPPTATRTAHTECGRSIARWQPKLDTDAVRLLGSLALLHYGKAAAWAHRLCVEQPTTTNKQGKVTVRYPRGERPDSAGWHRAPARANLQGSDPGGVRRLDERGGAEALVACRVGVGDAGRRDGARVGGSLRLVMRSPDGEEFGGRGEYLEITHPSAWSSPGPGMVTRGTKAPSSSRSSSTSTPTAPRPWC
jgi:hypothetical protein